MKVEVASTGRPVADVREMILGQNVEMCITTADGLLSDRLRNSKFAGPPHRMTGLAPEWQGASCGRAAYELTPGAGLGGSEAQLIRVHDSSGGVHLHQNRVPVRAGEELELEVWARAWHEPVALRVALRPLASRTEGYSAGEIVVESSYYRRYSLVLEAPVDDDEACLRISIPGGGSLWIDQIHLRPRQEPLLSAGVIREMSEMRIPTLRFPGGIVVNAYNWRRGTGPVHLRPSLLEAAFHQDWSLNYDFGLDEYLQLCLEQGITPTLTLNVATGTPQEAEDLARYCADWFRNAGVEPPLTYWHVANHPYIHTTAHMTPEMYAEVLRTFVPRVKAGYPKVRTVAVMNGQELGVPAGEAPWKQTLLDNREIIDVVEVQFYGDCSTAAPPEEQARQLVEALERFESSARAFVTESRSQGAGWNLGVAEWNWWMRASHWDGRGFEEPPTVLHGLFIAGMIHRFAALAPDLEVAHFYNLVNCMGILNRRGADVEVTDAVEVFKLYRPALPGRFVPLEISAGKADRTAPVEGLCLQGADTHWLFLVNRSVSEAAQVSLAGFGAGAGKCSCLRGESLSGSFARDESAKVSEGAVELPPLSILRVAMDAAGP